MIANKNKKSKSSQLKVRTHLRAGFSLDQVRGSLQPFVTEISGKAQDALSGAQNIFEEGI